MEGQQKVRTQRDLRPKRGTQPGGQQKMLVSVSVLSVLSHTRQKDIGADLDEPRHVDLERGRAALACAERGDDRSCRQR